MQVYLRFPLFREKAVTLSYDDGTIYDKRLAEIVKEYGLKCTFNLNSGMFGEGRRLGLDDVKKLYCDKDFEVAIHGFKHINLKQCPLPIAYREVYEDKLNLEKTFGKVIRGMAFAYGYYTKDVINMLKDMNIAYSRTTVDTHAFSLPDNWLELKGTCYHRFNERDNLVKRFLEISPNKFYDKNPMLFYLWGHSYEFNDNNEWDIIENFCKTFGKDDNIYKATNIEIYDYQKAFQNLEYSADGHIIKNNSNIDLYLLIDGKGVLIKANSTVDV